MESLNTIRNPRSAAPSSEGLINQRKQARRESCRWLRKFLSEMLYKDGPDHPYDGHVYEGPIGWDVVVICPDSRDPSDPLYREPHGYGALDAWLIRGGELYRFVHGGPEEIANTLP